MNAAILALLLPALGAGQGRAWQERASRDEGHAREAPPATEGPLDNDVFVPIAETAATELASGDQALARSRAASAPANGTAPNPAEAARLLDVALDHWRAALLAGGPGASTWLAGTNASERRLAEGVHAGVVRRLGNLGEVERARWSARLAAEADAALAALDTRPPAARAELLAELVRVHPGTAAAARAALVLGDVALEAGLTRRARAWYERGEREALLADEPSVPEALHARRVALPATSSTAGGELWERATACDFVDALSWNESGPPRSRAPAGEHGVRPGGAFAGDASFVVQTAAELLLFSLSSASELELTARMRPADFLGSQPPDVQFEAPREPPGWPLLPLVDDLGVVLVVGRMRPGEPNALLALALEAPSLLQGLGLDLGRPGGVATRAWSILGSERRDAAGEALPIAALEELGDHEIQPGPVGSGDLVVVQARAVEGQVRSWLLAFDRRDGALAWKRLLAAGADRVPARRFAPVSRHVASQPLLALAPGEPEVGARVFAGTHLGLGVLVDGLLGEPLWSFKNRRRDAFERGWTGDRPPAVDADGSSLVLWAPMDSDRFYSLAARGLSGTAPDETQVLTRPPAPLGDAEVLVGGGAESHLVLSSRAGERAVSEVRAGVGRIDSLALARDERFSGLGLASAERAWTCTNRGLYLFDRTRELYLLDRTALPAAGGGPPGGDLHARGAHVVVLGTGALWWFRGR